MWAANARNEQLVEGGRPRRLLVDIDGVDAVAGMGSHPGDAATTHRERRRDGIARDVTEQRVARVALEEAPTAADDARQAAEAANRTKSEFLSRMSHELR